MIGVEAGGHGIETGLHAASLTGGKPGVLHGNRTYLLQNEDGQIRDAHSISAGLDYPGIGPEHAWLHELGRVQYVSITDDEALEAFQLSSRLEGIIPALEPAHALAHVAKIAPTLPRDHLIVMNMCGRGDKDIFAVADHLGRPAVSRIERRFAALRAEGRAGLVTYLTAGDPDPDTSARLFGGLAAAGADLIEIGMPFSDPMADGPAIQEAGQRALKAGHDLAPHLGAGPRAAPRRRGDPDRADGLLQPDLPLRHRRASRTMPSPPGSTGSSSSICRPRRTPS